LQPNGAAIPVRLDIPVLQARGHLSLVLGERERPDTMSEPRALVEDFFRHEFGGSSPC
jgi:hypothetical protein